MRHSPERLHQCPNNYSLVCFFQTHNVFGKILQHSIKSLFLSPACTFFWKMYENKNISTSYRNKHFFFCQVNHTHWLLFLYVCFCFVLFILSQSHLHRAVVVAYWKQHKSNNAVFQGKFLYNSLALDVKMHPIKPLAGQLLKMYFTLILKRFLIFSKIFIGFMEKVQYNFGLSVSLCHMIM